jgi:hypothetical protein
VLGSYMEEHGVEREKLLSVARATLNVGRQSTVGVIATHGNPTSAQENAVIGADAFLRAEKVLGADVLTGSFWLQRSFSAGRPGRDWAYGGRVELPNEPLSLALGVTEIQGNFHPALGFVNRRDIREYELSARFRRRFRPESAVRRVDSGVGLLVVTDTANALETVDGRVDLFNVENDPGDSLKLTYRFLHERIDEEFRIASGRIRVPAGEFSDHRLDAGVETSEARPVSVALEIGHGGYYTGSRFLVKPRLALRLAPHLRLSLEYEENRIRTPAGRVDVRLGLGRAILQLSPGLSWSTLVQYDNLSRSIGVHSRLRFIFQPGNELFLVLGQSLAQEDERRGFALDGTEAAAKLVWTLRF